MTLQELIAQCDIQHNTDKARAEQLINEAGEFLYQATQKARFNFERYNDSYYKVNGLFASPFNWLGMNMWPNAVDDRMRTSLVITLSQAQMKALLSITFQGHKQGGVRKYGLMYWWQFQPREDGWIELLVEEK